MRDPSEALQAYVDAVTDRTRFALVSHVTSPTALVLPVRAIVRELDRRGVDTLVDGAHAPGMIDVDLGTLGAAYWTGNGHKWLCAPMGSGVLHVRADLRDRIRPLVISHGANSERADRARFRLLFDWPGTSDPTPYLTMPAAIRYVGAIHDDGWAGLMRSNAALARRARDVLCAALGVSAPSPDAMLGAMASIPLPGLPLNRGAAARLQAELFDEDRIEVPIVPFPVPAAAENGRPPAQVLIRISAQVYNRPEEYEVLAERLAQRLHTAEGPRSLLGRLRGG
jgi:isopenicillin-N epimerase